MKKAIRFTVDTLTLTAIADLFISLAFFALAAISFSMSGVEAIAITFPQYALLLLFAFIIALSSRALQLFTWRAYVKIPLHFAVLLATFFLVFILAGKIATTPPSILIFTVIFSVIYALVSLVVYLFRRLLSAVEPTSESKDHTKVKKKEKYQSMF